jgi:hypothetical protein
MLDIVRSLLGALRAGDEAMRDSIGPADREVLLRCRPPLQPRGIKFLGAGYERAFTTGFVIPSGTGCATFR